ncbi:hypothetical protein [Trujillonella humicola]|uniref:hypothetical protein n=1 Tax=Trujillonella humicola TaxID=3383699 RepID=UPI003906A1F9
MASTTVRTAAQADPDVARRAWPRWLAAGAALVVVAVVAAVWTAGGARLLLAALGFFGAVRGATLVAGTARARLDPRARGLGAGTAVAGVAALAVAAVPGSLAGWVLLVGAPLGLLALSLLLLSRGGVARRGGLVALVWSVLVTGLLVGAGLATDWARARGGATLVAALGVAVLGLVLVAGSAGLRAAAARPAPPQPAGCAGCECSGGGCGIPRAD